MAVTTLILKGALGAAVLLGVSLAVFYFFPRDFIRRNEEPIAFQEGSFCAVGGCGASNNEVDASATQLPQDGFTTITSRELDVIMESKNFFFINVHVPYEGEIKNTDAFIPYDKVSENLSKFPLDKNAKIILYCRSGRMSGIAAKELAGLGYANVSHLGGGMIDWEKNGYEIIRK